MADRNLSFREYKYFKGQLGTLLELEPNSIEEITIKQKILGLAVVVLKELVAKASSSAQGVSSDGSSPSNPAP